MLDCLNTEEQYLESIAFVYVCILALTYAHVCRQETSGRMLLGYSGWGSLDGGVSDDCSVYFLDFNSVLCCKLKIRVSISLGGRSKRQYGTH